jgi:hypothetical protein
MFDSRREKAGSFGSAFFVSAYACSLSVIFNLDGELGVRNRSAVTDQKSHKTFWFQYPLSVEKLSESVTNTPC